MKIQQWQEHSPKAECWILHIPFLQKFNRIDSRQFPLLPLLSSGQTMLCRKQQCSSHCSGLKLKIKTFCLCFLPNKTHLHPE